MTIDFNERDVNRKHRVIVGINNKQDRRNEHDIDKVITATAFQQAAIRN